MKNSRLYLFVIISVSFLASAVFTGCGKGKRDKVEDFEWSDSVGRQCYGDDIPDTMPHAIEKEEVRRHEPDSLLDPKAAPPAKRASKRRSYGGYDGGEDLESAVEEAAKERRMKKLNRDFDAGLYGEHTRGFDRDNYDPDIDDW